MAAKNVLGIIFSNADDEAAPELTALRTMGSVPFAGRYRLIDFPLSNMVNAGVPQVGVITKSNYRSLMDHIGNGKPWDLSRKREGMTLLPPFSSPETDMIRGKADSLYGCISYISNSGKDRVLLADCNAICNIDYGELIRVHEKTDADVAVAYYRGIPPKIEGSVRLEIDGSGRVCDVKSIDRYDAPVNYSLKIMVIKRTLLERLIHEARGAGIDDFRTIIRNNVSRLRIFGCEEKGFVRVLASLQDYYDISMELLELENRKELFTAERPVYTKVSDQVPTKYGIGAKASNSLIADGCRINGEVVNSILFRGATVAKGAKVRDSIIMQGSFIGENSSLECVIIDKSSVVKHNKKLCGATNYPIYIGKGIVI